MMNELVLFVGLLIGNLTITSYRSIPSQTDSSPNFTSTGDLTHRGGCAVSRNLLSRWNGPLNYGDYVYIEGLGIYQVNDCMAKRHRNAIDIWVASKEEEHKIGVQHHKVYLLTRKIHGY